MSFSISQSRHQIINQLKQLRSDKKANTSRRYFTHEVAIFGVNATDIKQIIKDFHEKHTDIPPENLLCLTEYLLENAEFHEEKLVAFGLLNKVVKRNFDDTLMQRFEFWLENYADNWALVDDLCLKTIYQFLLSRPHLIEQTQHWIYTSSPWCRRAGNVVWVKFINRKIGKSTYKLDKKLIFKNCDHLLNDPDIFVQKSIGWLLKVTAAYHLEDVIDYLSSNIKRLNRLTLRYAIEKMDAETRKHLLSLK